MNETAEVPSSHRPIAEIDRDWRGASEYMKGHYAAELIRALRAEIRSLRSVLEEAIAWDGQDDEGVDAVWLAQAEVVMLRTQGV